MSSFVVVVALVETLMVLQCASHLVSEGTVPVPRTAPAPGDGIVLPSLELSLQRDATATGAKALVCRSPKRALRKIV